MAHTKRTHEDTKALKRREKEVAEKILDKIEGYLEGSNAEAVLELSRAYAQLTEKGC